MTLAKSLEHAISLHPCPSLVEEGFPFRPSKVVPSALSFPRKRITCMCVRASTSRHFNCTKLLPSPGPLTFHKNEGQLRAGAPYSRVRHFFYFFACSHIAQGSPVIQLGCWKVCENERESGFDNKPKLLKSWKSLKQFFLNQNYIFSFWNRQ